MFPHTSNLIAILCPSLLVRDQQASSTSIARSENEQMKAPSLQKQMSHMPEP